MYFVTSPLLECKLVQNDSLNLRFCQECVFPDYLPGLCEETIKMPHCPYLC